MKERICQCGDKFDTLEEFCDHNAEHNSTPAQWTTAYKSIQDDK